MVVGTPEYVSPEVLLSIEQKGATNSYGVECDWWSYGILAYEMVYGRTPFEDDSHSQMELFNKIMNYDKFFRFPESSEKGGKVSTEMKLLIRHLLTAPNKRLLYSQIRGHAFFSGLNFDRLRSMPPPFVPELSGPIDTKYFPVPEKAHQLSPTKADTSCISPDNHTMAGFDFVRSESMKQVKGNGSSHRDKESHNGESGDGDNLSEFNRDCSNMLRRLQENDRMISALRGEISQRVAIFEQVQLQRDMLERDLTKQMAENALLTRQVSLQRRELENLERAVRHQLSDVRRQLQVKSSSSFTSQPATPAHTQTDENSVLDVESLLEQLSTLREQNEALLEEKHSLQNQLQRAENRAKESARQVTIQRQSSVRDSEGLAQRLRNAESESHELRKQFDEQRFEHSNAERKLNTELATSKSEIARLEIELADARERSHSITGLRSRLADAETKVVLLEQRLQRTTAKLEEKERMLYDKEHERITASRVSYAASPRRTKTTTAAVGTSPTLLGDDLSSNYKQRFEKLEKESHKKYAEYEAKIAEIERTRDDSKAMVARLKKLLTETETELETTRRQYEKLRSDHGGNERQIRRELESVRSELVAAKEAANEAKKVKL